MRVRIEIFAAIALVAAVAVGCSGQSSGEDAPSQSARSSEHQGSKPTTAKTEPVPPPSKGNTKETVPSGTQASKKPVGLDESSNSGDVVVKVTDVKTVKAKAQIPGEVSGPGLLISVSVKNNSEKALDLGAVLVTVYDSSDAPAGEMTMAPNKPMKGSLKPGATAKGAYLFTIPKKRRSPIVVNVTLPTGSPVAVFRGDAPKD